jgi:thymidine kinase
MLREFDELLPSVLNNYDVILINEGQFFNKLRDNVLNWCDRMKKIVVVSGLDGNFKRGKFGEMVDLIPDCDEIIKLKAYCSLCKDGTEALFSWKTTKNNNLIDIGTDNYIPLCRYHYNKQKKMLSVRNTNVISNSN